MEFRSVHQHLSMEKIHSLIGLLPVPGEFSTPVVASICCSSSSVRTLSQLVRFCCVLSVRAARHKDTSHHQPSILTRDSVQRRPQVRMEPWSARRWSFKHCTGSEGKATLKAPDKFSETFFHTSRFIHGLFSLTRSSSGEQFWIRSHKDFRKFSQDFTEMLKQTNS